MVASGGLVKDWDKVYENGFVIAPGNALNSPETIEETDMLVGICISDVNKIDKVANNAIVIAIPVTRPLMDYETDDGTVTLKAYVRQCNDKQWSYWYLMDIGTGKPDALPIENG